ncbi:hypothetical protein C7W93_07490 [Glaciimonas sp. PCH181]|nr:hypothetical protein C7W93_07490 [Glaciimonas sp. PCH181]
MSGYEKGYPATASDWDGLGGHDGDAQIVGTRQRRAALGIPAERDQEETLQKATVLRSWRTWSMSLRTGNVW